MVNERGIILEQDSLFTAARLFCGVMQIMLAEPSIVAAGWNDLTGTQYQTLRYLLLHDAPTGGELAEGLSISNAATTKLLDRLEGKGLIRRRASPGDRRAMRLELTANGREAAAGIMKAEEQAFTSILAQMETAEVESLRGGLRAFMASALTEASQVDRVCLRCGVAHDPLCPGNQIYTELTGHTRTNV